MRPSWGVVGKTPRAKWKRADADRDAGVHFGAKLKALRLDRGMSLVEVAARTGVSAATLSRMENNKMAATYAVLVKIVSYFDLEWTDMLPATSCDPVRS